MNAILGVQERFFSFWLSWRAQHPNWMLGAELIFLLAAFVLLRKRSIRRTCLSEKEYHRKFLFPALLRGRARPFMALLGLLPLALGWRRLAWDELSTGPALRWLIILTVLPLAWQFATYAFNFYYGVAHRADRVLAAALGLLVIFHPGFAPIFNLTVLMLFQQFRYPIARHFRWTDKEALIEILIFFHAFLLLRLFVAPVSMLAFTVAAFCVLAASYFYSGVRKIQLRWAKHERLSYLFAASCQNGWLKLLTPEQRMQFAAWLDHFSEPLKWGTLLLEFGIIFALLHPLVAALFLLGLIGMHVGIFISSGILFWKWMFLDAAFIPLIFECWRALPESGIHPLIPWVYSVIIILISPRLWAVKKLGWVDSQLYGVYRFELVMADGSTCIASPAQLEPYDFPMSQGRLHFLQPKPADSPESDDDEPVDYTRMLNLKSEAEIEAARAAFRGVWGSRNRTEQFNKLMARYFSNRNRLGVRTAAWARRFMAPKHIWTYPVGDCCWDGCGNVEKLRIRYVETIFDEGNWRTIGDTIIHEVKIQDS